MTQTHSLIFKDGIVSQPITREVSALLNAVRTSSNGIHWSSLALDHNAYLEVFSDGKIKLTNLNVDGDDVFTLALSQSELLYLQLMRSSRASSDSVSLPVPPLRVRTSDTLISVVEIGFVTHQLQDENTKDVTRMRMVTIAVVKEDGAHLKWCFPTLVTPGMAQHVSDWDDESGLPVIFQPF